MEVMATSEANCETSTSISAPKGKDGQYRCKIWTPRQTIYSRRLKPYILEGWKQKLEMFKIFFNIDILKPLTMTVYVYHLL